MCDSRSGRLGFGGGAIVLRILQPRFQIIDRRQHFHDGEICLRLTNLMVRSHSTKRNDKSNLRQQSDPLVS
jgi:hypothetical protein